MNTTIRGSIGNFGLIRPEIRFQVFDLDGRLISNGETPADFQSGGQYKHQMDISKLQGGFYLLVMTDEEGARLTRRFVKN